MFIGLLIRVERRVLFISIHIQALCNWATFNFFINGTRLRFLGHALAMRDRSHLPTFCHRQAVQVGDQPVPVAVAVGGGLNIAGLVGQDALGGGQGHRVFADDGVVGASFTVLGHIEQGIDAAGCPIM